MTFSFYSSLLVQKIQTIDCCCTTRSSLRLSFGRFEFTRQNLYSRQPAWFVGVEYASARYGVSLSLGDHGTCPGRIVQYEKDSGTSSIFSKMCQVDHTRALLSFLLWKTDNLAAIFIFCSNSYWKPMIVNFVAYV